MNDFTEVITDAQTGEVTVRPFTQEEVDEHLANRAPRSSMTLSFSQLLIGLVAEGWITEADGEGWLAGTLPPAVLATINLIPAENRFAAKTRALRPSYVARLDPLVVMMAMAQGRTEEEIDNFFLTYASV